MKISRIVFPGRAVSSITRAPRWRSSLLTSLLLLIAFLTWQTIPKSTTSQSRDDDDDEDSAKSPLLQISNTTLGLESGDTKTVPSQLGKVNPQFHLFIHAPTVNLAVCRSILSSFILDYPPPTLIGYTPADTSLSQRTAIPDHDTTASENHSGIVDVSAYLHSQARIHDSDAVLIVNGETTLFQLPPDALLSTFAEETRLTSRRLAARYSSGRRVQHFNHSVFFGSSGAGEGVEEAQGSLDDAFIMGSARSVRRVFNAAGESNVQAARPDSATFDTLFAQQELARDAVSDRQRLSSCLVRIWKQWFGPRSQVDGHVAEEQKKQEHDEISQRELEIGIDDGRLISNVDGRSENALNAPTDDMGKGEDDENRGTRGVTNATNAARLPAVLVEKGVRGPFAMHTVHLHPTLSPRPHSPAKSPIFSSSSVKDPIDLPPPSTPWTSLSFLPSPSHHIPALLSLSSSPTSARNVYDRMWFRPHAHALLQSYLLRSLSREIAFEAAVGGERWYDRRGGRGGMWTVDGEWIDGGELCGGFSEELFGVLDGDSGDGGDDTEAVTGANEANDDGKEKKKKGSGKAQTPQWRVLTWGRLNAVPVSSEKQGQHRGPVTLVVDGKGGIVGLKPGLVRETTASETAANETDGRGDRVAGYDGGAR